MNKKIKIIELYNKVANNKDLPEQIRWEGMIWTLDVGRDYISETGRTLGSDVRLDELNDEVEILDTPKKIEKINHIVRINDLIPPVDANEEFIWRELINHHNKLNEVIDKINEMESKE